MVRAGIDLGGTKIEAIALDDAGQSLVCKRISTPSGYDAAIRGVAGLVTELERQTGRIERVGVGHPGSASPKSGLIRGANSTWLNGRDFRADLSAALDRATRFANDADCFAMSEATDGAGAGSRTVFGVILGTGVGGGIVIDGQLHSGAQNIAGEWGHTALPRLTEEEYPGPDCWCGQVSCVEAWLSGPGIAAEYESRTGRQADSAAILSEPAELKIYAGRLARALSTVVNILDPDAIILGGGVSNTPGLPEAVETALHGQVFSDVLNTRVLRHRHGDSSGVRGAAMLWSAAE